MNFFDYLTGIAPEGETVLVIKQKPIGGTYSDGALRCVWPSYRPSKYTGEGAWYANTAMFILDRYKTSKMSFAAHYCERVGFLILDDVGTKSRIAPLEPTWKMETSPDNYQWGYTFALDDQPTKGEFSAAIIAIANAGFTDRGAINPVRNFRLPGSVNLKPGRGEFAARLAEFHPEREFSLDQICTALGVTPGAADTASTRKITLSDNGNDDVLAWLFERGEVLEPANGEGWVGIQCPNAGDHSDGNPMGRYHPVNRAYTCFHGHCGDWDSRRFLCWVADEGGPKHQHGLRDELLAQSMSTALAKLKPTEAYRDEAAEVIADVERKELGRLQKAEWYARFAYVQEDETFFDMQERREVSRATFNALYRHISCKSIHTGRRIEASVCFDEHRQAMGAKALVGITYAAGEGVLAVRDGDVYGNRWRDARPEVGPVTSVEPWLEHCRAMVPEESELNHIFDVLAFKVQNPGIKINHAILHGGDQGAGKDTMYAPFIYAVCGPHRRNLGIVDNDNLASAWGYHLESEILILNELKEPDARDRRALANKLKPIIAAPPEVLSINRKGLHPYMMLNRVFVLAFSNEQIPIVLDSQDRRWFCVWTHAPRMTREAADRFYHWLQHQGGYDACAAWLHARDVSKFSPTTAPMMTEFKLNLVEHGMSSVESYLVDLLRFKKLEFAKGVVGSPFHAICDKLSGNAPNGSKVPQVALLHAFKEAGWIDLGRVATADLSTKKHLFCAPDMVAHGKPYLRRLIDAPAGAIVSKFGLVKKEATP